MSVAVMGEVFRRYPHGGNEKLLALALADHALDDGTRIFPSVEALAKKVRVSERTVQRLLIKMVEEGWLQLVRDTTGGRGQTRVYRISPAWLNGDNLSPLRANETSNKEALNGDNLSPFENTHTTETVTPRVVNGDIAMSPEPSEPSVVSSYELPTGDCREQDDPGGGIRWDGADGIFVGISEEQMRAWEEAFRPVDVDAELTQMELWWQANPRKRKRNIARFITGWLRRERQRLTTLKARTLHARKAHA